jgi:sepiapterin reductase
MSLSTVVPHGPYAKVCLIVTGASRGLGRAIAVTMCRQFLEDPGPLPEGSDQQLQDRPQHPYNTVHAVLVARSASGLQETATEIMKLSVDREAQPSFPPLPPSLTVGQVVADLSDLSALDATLDAILEQCKEKTATSAPQESRSKCRLILINNAGSLGHVGLCTDTPSLSSLQQSIDLNVTSSLWMSSRVLRWASEQSKQQHALAVDDDDDQSRPFWHTTIVNISSLCAIQSMPTMALYSAGKAARDSYHAALALEQDADRPNNGTVPDATVRILNYAPGPLETEMTSILRQCDALDATLKPHFQKKLVDPMDSAALLSRLLRQDAFVNGAHVDYYDCLE